MSSWTYTQEYKNFDYFMRVVVLHLLFTDFGSVKKNCYANIQSMLWLDIILFNYFHIKYLDGDIYPAAGIIKHTYVILILLQSILVWLYL